MLIFFSLLPFGWGERNTKAYVRQRREEGIKRGEALKIGKMERNVYAYKNILHWFSN